MNNKINWKQKLTSRKLWVTIIGIIIGVAMSFGVGESDYGEEEITYEDEKGD